MTTSTESLPAEVSSLLAEVDQLAAAGRNLEAVDRLSAVGGGGHPALERRLAALRYDAFGELDHRGFDRWPVPADGVDRSGPAAIPEVAPGELTADAVRRGIQSRGAVLVRGLFAGREQPFIDGIETSLAAQAEATSGGEGDPTWFSTLRLPREEAKSLARYWVSGAGGMLACDSPRLLQMLFHNYAEVGLREVVDGYLGERSVLSANKCTMRRVPLSASTDWHQDGAFLGKGIRALNIWIALSECGIDSPGMDLVPKRFEEVVETGTGGAIFDWAVGPETVERLTPDAPPVRPHFQAGDALFFDDLFLHRTAVEPTMTRPRYAIESWFFAPTDYPSGQVPLVW